jgi:major membrane immunogen (membrane-anchored lipoprotein)
MFKITAKVDLAILNKERVKMKKGKIFLSMVLVLTVMLISVPLLSGCGKVAQFSDPVTENILVSMNNSDYAGFSRDFDDTMKTELTEANFPDLLAQVTGAVGNYKAGSKKIVGVNINNDLTTATYTADFENAEDVSVEVTFKEIDGAMKVVGLWFK